MEKCLLTLQLELDMQRTSKVQRTMQRTSMQRTSRRGDM
jgi:hypothetical protein